MTIGKGLTALGLFLAVIGSWLVSKGLDFNARVTTPGAASPQLPWPTTRSAPITVTATWKWRLGWGAVIIGFVLQLAGLFL